MRKLFSETSQDSVCLMSPEPLFHNLSLRSCGIILHVYVTSQGKNYWCCYGKSWSFRQSENFPFWMTHDFAEP